MKLMNEYKKKLIIIFNMENIKCAVIDNIKTETSTRFEDIISCVEKEEETRKKKNEDGDENFTAIFYLLEEEYNEFTKKELERICDYYGISKRKKRKCELIQDIIIFEQDEINSEVVNKRHEMWYCIEQIKNDNYLKKFLILE